MKKENIDISFIIPVYNGVSVIGRLLDSVSRMPREISCEIIAADDGSDDGTLRILREKENADERVKVLALEHSGQSGARNAGLEAARGTYVFFADADDEVDAQGIAKLFASAEKDDHDVVCGTYVRLEPGKADYTACEGIPEGKVSRAKEGSEIFRALKTESAFGYIWNKLFRRSFLLENGLGFDASIRVFMEDQLFNLKAFGCKADYYYLNEVVYRYHFEGESTTRRPDPEIAAKSIEMLKSYDAFLKEKGIRGENMDLFVPLAMRMACWSAFKNISYEGASYSKIKERLDMFADADELKYMFEDPNNIRYLKELPSFLQRRLFCTSFRLLARKRTGFLAFLFKAGSPVLKAAAKNMVR